MSGTDWTIIDTETTGIAAPIYTLEIAAQRMRGLMPVGKPFQAFLNHEVDVPREAQAIHGYSRKFLQENGMPPRQAHSLLAEYAGNTPLAAYNLPYDYDKVLVPEWKRLGLRMSMTRGFCVMRLTQKLLNPSPAGNYKLQSLRSHFGLPDRVAHSAVGDVLTVIDLIGSVLLPHLQKLGIHDAKTIARYLDGPGYSDRLPFGKHEGRHWKEALSDQDMLGWPLWLEQQGDANSVKMSEWYLSKVNNAQVLARNSQEQKELASRTITTKLKGTKHYDALTAHRNNLLYEGVKLDCQPEPRNPHDRNAVSVWLGKNKIGYISREIAEKYQKLIISDKLISSTVSAIVIAENGRKIEVYAKIRYIDHQASINNDDSDVPIAPGVYEIHLNQERYYIGSTSNLRLRRQQHLAQLNRGTHVNIHLQHDFNRLENSKFQFAVLVLTDNVDLAHSIEKKEILKRLFDGANLYNCTADGQGVFSEIGANGGRTISDLYAENPELFQRYISNESATGILKIDLRNSTEKARENQALPSNEKPMHDAFTVLMPDNSVPNVKSSVASGLTGKGRYEWPNGDRYEGDFTNGERTGRGIIKFANNESYAGDFVCGRKSGKGIFCWPDGSRYEGDWVDDKRTGKGIYFWPNGSRYDGDWLEGKMTGWGVYTWSDKSRYEGDWVDNKRTGKGIYISPSGDRYEGDFVEGMQTGRGIKFFANGDVYEGDFLNNAITGEGVVRFPSGDIYIGELVQGLREGKGTYKWKNGDQYQGNWQQGHQSGEGILLYKNGARKEGTFINGIFQENPACANITSESSVRTWPDGRRYEGSWVNGKRSGKGTITYPTGDRYSGDWVEDHCTGKGVFWYANGDRYEGDFVEGRRIGKGRIWYSNGDYYEGDFSNNCKNGKGIEQLSSGNRYEGQFYNNSRHGIGKEWLPNGETYEGEFKGNTRCGKGLLILRDGSKYLALFKNGKFVERLL